MDATDSRVRQELTASRVAVISIAALSGMSKVILTHYNGVSIIWECTYPVLVYLFFYWLALDERDHLDRWARSFESYDSSGSIAEYHSIVGILILTLSLSKAVLAYFGYYTLAVTSEWISFVVLMISLFWFGLLYHCRTSREPFFRSEPDYRMIVQETGKLIWVLFAACFGCYFGCKWVDLLWLFVWKLRPQLLVADTATLPHTLWMYGLWFLVSYYSLVRSFGFPFSGAVIIMAISAYGRRGTNDATLQL